MDINEFLGRINSHTKAIYENEIEGVAENGKIVNWLLGLAGGALLFSFNKYATIDSQNLYLIITQACIFITIIITGFLHRIVTKSFRSYTISIIRMFEFLRIEFELVPDEIESELKNEKLDKVFHNYLNGEYFDEQDSIIFENLGKKQIRSYRLTIGLAIFSVMLMLMQFGCFFVMVLK